MSCNAPGFRRSVSLAGGRAAVAEGLHFARDFAAAADLDEETGIRLAVIVEELIANIVEHGGIGSDEGIGLTIERQDEAVLMSIVDRGEPFDPRLSVQSDALPDRGGGAGLAIVRAWSTILSYRRIGDANELRLVIGLGAA